MRKGITDFWKTSQSHSLTRDPSEPLKRENYWKSVLEVASRVHKTEVFKKGWNLQVVLVCELHHEKTLFFMEERNGTFTMKLSSAALSYLNAHFLKCEHCVCRPPFRSEKFNIVSNDHEHAQKCSFYVSVCKTNLTGHRLLNTIVLEIHFRSVKCINVRQTKISKFRAFPFLPINTDASDYKE